MQISLTFLGFDRFEPNDSSKNILRERFVNNFYCIVTTKAVPVPVQQYLADIRQNRPEFALLRKYFLSVEQCFAGKILLSIQEHDNFYCHRVHLGTKRVQKGDERSYAGKKA